jgi:glycosyltransferase involved in cell wall biosynthesis
MPTLSIIIPTKNEEANLPALFSSIAKQTYRDFEMIVPDNRSTDRTREIAAAAGARIVQGDLPGPARNRGAEAASGMILLFLDADVVLPDEKFLMAAVTEMRAKNIDVAAPDIVPISDRTIDRYFYGFYNRYARIMQNIFPHAPGFCMLSTREAHRKIRGFDEDVAFAEDHDYAQRARRAGLRFGLLHTPTPVRTSVRRFTKDGRTRILFVYVWTEIRMMLIGPYKRKMPFKYEMGGQEKGSGDKGQGSGGAQP